jgi:hypothetical protein
LPATPRFWALSWQGWRKIRQGQMKDFMSRMRKPIPFVIGVIAIILVAITTSVSTAANVTIAILTCMTIVAYKKQIQIGQGQVKATIEQTICLTRPVLAPTMEPDFIVWDDGQKRAQFYRNPATIWGLKNIGVGPAFNIYGTFCGYFVDGIRPLQGYIFRNYAMLTRSDTSHTINLSMWRDPNKTIAGHPLHVPGDTQYKGRIVRLILTYHDISRHKFASIYDFHRDLGWICVGHFQNIECDIRDLDYYYYVAVI